MSFPFANACSFTMNKLNVAGHCSMWFLRSLKTFGQLPLCVYIYSQLIFPGEMQLHCFFFHFSQIWILNNSCHLMTLHRLFRGRIQLMHSYNRSLYCSKTIHYTHKCIHFIHVYKIVFDKMHIYHIFIWRT